MRLEVEGPPAASSSLQRQLGNLRVRPIILIAFACILVQTVLQFSTCISYLFSKPADHEAEPDANKRGHDRHGGGGEGGGGVIPGGGGVIPLPPPDPVRPSTCEDVPVITRTDLRASFLDDFIEVKTKGVRPKFMSFWTEQGNTGSLILEFPLPLISDGHQLEIGVGAILMRGEFAHMDASETDEIMLSLRLSEDKSSVEILQPKLWFMHGEHEYQKIAAEASQPEMVARLTVLGFRQDASCAKTHVFVDASTMLAAGLFILSPPSFIGYLEHSTIRTFEKNVDFSVVYSREFMAARTPREQHETYLIDNQEQIIRYCIYELPQGKDVLPRRFADDRVGYFHQRLQLLGDYREEKDKWPGYRPEELIDPFFRIIQRQKIQTNKATNKREIVFYVDPTVPSDFHESTKLGIQMWQKAFDEVDGDVTIRSSAPGDADFPEDYDVADIRFNSISWCTGDEDQVFSIGQSVIDPRSGQILKANIVFTLGWLRSWLGQGLLVNPAWNAEGAGATERRLQAQLVKGLKGPHAIGRRKSTMDTLESDPSRQEDRYAQVLGSKRHTSERSHDAREQTNISKGRTWWHSIESEDWPCRHHGPSLKHRHPHESLMCRALHDHSTPLWILAAEPSDAEILSHFKDGIAELTAHEVGHTLGLRHNFRGSTASSLKDLQNPTHVQVNGLTASVMDYVAVNILSKKGRDQIIADHYSGNDPGQAPAFSPVIGAYDKVAIKYGYSKQDADHFDPGTNAFLKGILDEAARDPVLRRVGFATDGDVSFQGGLDPRTAVYDLGAEPFDFHVDQNLLVAEVQDVLFKRAVKKDESFARIYGAQFRLLMMSVRTSLNLARYVGGYQLSNLRAIADCPEKPERQLPACLPEGPEPVRAVSFELQTKAAQHLLMNVVMAPVGSASGPSIYGQYNLEQWSVDNFDEFYSVLPSDFIYFVNLIRRYVLVYLFHPDRLQRFVSALVQRQKADDTAPERLTSFLQLASRAILGVKLIEGPDAGYEPFPNDGDDADTMLTKALKDHDSWNIMFEWIEHLTMLAKCDRCMIMDQPVAALATAEVYRLLDSLEKYLTDKTQVMKSHESNYKEYYKECGFLRRAVAKLKSVSDQPVSIEFR